MSRTKFVQRKPIPTCPNLDCCTEMVLREPNDWQNWEPFWGPDAEPKACHWLTHVWEDSDEDWCWDCALHLCDYFNGKAEKPPTIWKDEQIPDWPQQPDSTEVDGGWAIESDSARFCHRCGCRLEFCPTDEFVKSELKHYKEYAPKDDWWSFLTFLEAVNESEYSDQPLYAEALALARKYVK